MVPPGLITVRSVFTGTSSITYVRYSTRFVGPMICSSRPLSCQLNVHDPAGARPPVARVWMTMRCYGVVGNVCAPHV